MPTQADNLIQQVLSELHLQDEPAEAVYGRINEIVTRLQAINALDTIAVKTTGTISERLCEYGLRAACPNSYRELSSEWKWIGDFYITGAPFNAIISVKSFKAKERLLSSGTGNLLSPTLGWGLFNDPAEWSGSRVQSYLFRAFLKIYIPEMLLSTLPVQNTLNINGRPFLRNLSDFVHDIQEALTDDVLDPRRL